MSAVVFIIPPHLKKRGRLIPSHHPIVTATLAGVAKAAGVNVFVIDMGVTSLSSADVCSHLFDIQPDWVGLIPFGTAERCRYNLLSTWLQQLRRDPAKCEIWTTGCPLHSERVGLLFEMAHWILRCLETVRLLCIKRAQQVLGQAQDFMYRMGYGI